MANFRSSARRGRFSRRDQGDFGIKAFSEQQQNIVKFLDRERRQAKEQGDSFAAALKGVANTEAENNRIINKLDNDIYKTQYNAIQVKGQREVEALEQEAKELESSAKFWADFSGTGARNLGKAAGAITESADFIRGTNLYNAEEDQIRKYSIDLANLENIAVRDSLIYEKGLLTEKLKKDKVLSKEDQKRFDQIQADIKKQNTEIASVLGERRSNSNRQLVRLHIQDYKDNADPYHKNILVAWDKFVDEQRAKGIEVSSELIPGFYKEWAKEYLSQRGLSLKTDAAQEFITKISNEGAQMYGVFEGKAKFDKTTKLITGRKKTLKAATSDLERHNEIGGLVTAIASGTFKNDKNGEYYPFTGNLAEATLEAFNIIASDPTLTRVQLEQYLDTLVIGEGISYRDKLENNYDLETTVYTKYANAKKSYIQQENTLDKAKAEDWYTTEVEDKFDPDKNGIYDNSTIEGITVLNNLLLEAKTKKGSENVVNKIATLMLIDPDSTVPAITQWKLNTAINTKDWKWFNSIYTSGELTAQQKKQYSGVNVALAKIDNLGNNVDSRLETTIKAELGRSQIVKSYDKSLDTAVDFASNQVLNEYLDLVTTKSKDIEAGTTTHEAILSEAIETVIGDITSRKGIWTIKPVQAQGTAGATAYYEYFKNQKIGKQEDLSVNQLKTLLNTEVPVKDEVSYKRIVIDATQVKDKNAILSETAIANLIVDIENGQGVTIPESINVIAEAFKDTRFKDGSVMSSTKVINDILESSGSRVRVAPDVKAVAEAKGIDSKGKSANYCSAELLYNNIKEFDVLLIPNEMRVNLAKNSEQLIASLNTAGLIEGTDYTLNTEYIDSNLLTRGLAGGSNLLVGGSMFKIDPGYEHITPTSSEGLNHLLKNYKKLGFEIVLDGDIQNFTKCIFRKERSN